MSDFVWSIFIAIGIVVMALGIVTWITLRRIREEEARTKGGSSREDGWI